MLVLAIRNKKSHYVFTSLLRCGCSQLLPYWRLRVWWSRLSKRGWLKSAVSCLHTPTPLGALACPWLALPPATWPDLVSQPNWWKGWARWEKNVKKKNNILLLLESALCFRILHYSNSILNDKQCLFWQLLLPCPHTHRHTHKGRGHWACSGHMPSPPVKCCITLCINTACSL